MKYFSAKEIADKWGLSLRTIQNYCANERIPGAQNLGKQWLIPADAVRPSDTRAKESQPDTAYRFPLFIYSPAYASGPEFTLHEQALFAAQLKLLEGDNTESLLQCRELLKDRVPLHVAMGAYYVMANSSLLLGNYSEYKKAVEKMEGSVSPKDPHSEDYCLMVASIKRFVGWNHSLFDAINVTGLSSDALYFYQYECLLGVALRTEDLPANALHILDALVSQISLEGIAPLEANILFAVASLHLPASDSSAEALFDAACRIAISKNWLGIIEKNLSLGKTLIQKSLVKNAPGCYKKVAEMANRNYNNWRLVNSLAAGFYPFKNFSQSDIALLFMVYQGLSNEEICKAMDMTPKELQLLLQDCYQTAHVKNRSELRKYTVSQISTWSE